MPSEEDESYEYVTTSPILSSVVNGVAMVMDGDGGVDGEPMSSAFCRGTVKTTPLALKLIVRRMIAVMESILLTTSTRLSHLSQYAEQFPPHHFWRPICESVLMVNILLVCIPSF